MTPPPLTVLVVDPRAVAGGAQRLVASTVRGLVAAGDRVVAAFSEEGPATAWCHAAGADVHLVDPDVVDDDDVALETLIGLARPDVVVGVCNAGHLAAAPAAHRQGVPAIWWRMLTPRGRPHDVAATSVPADAIVCVNTAAAAAQRRRSPGARVVTIHPGVDVDSLAARRGFGDALRAELGWGDRPVVGMVARLDQIKGQDLFLDAAAAVVAAVPDAAFLVVGGDVTATNRAPSAAAQLEARAAALGLADRTVFTGHVDDPVPHLDAIDVLVQASAHESFGLSMVEGMALGTAIVATPADGPNDVIRPTIDGLVVERTPAAIATAVTELLRDARRATRLGQAARRRAALFTEERMLRELRTLFASVARDGPSGGHGSRGRSVASREST